MTNIRRITFQRVTTVDDEPTMVKQDGYDVGFKTFAVARFVSSDGIVSDSRWDPIHLPTGTYIGRWFGTRAEAAAYVQDFASWVGDTNREADGDLAKAVYNKNCPLIYNLVKAWPNGIVVMDAEPVVTLGRNEAFATKEAMQHWCTEPFSTGKVHIDVLPGEIRISDVPAAEPTPSFA